MAERPSVTTQTAGAQYETETLNNNFTNIRNRFDDVLGRDGTNGSNNTMRGDLDMGGYTIRNAVIAGDVTEAPDVGDSLVTATGHTASRTLSDHLSEPYNVRGFGAPTNGITSAYTHILAAQTAAGTKSLYFPAGTYLIDQDITFTSPLIFDGGAKIKVAAGTTITLDCGITAGLYQIFDTSAGSTAKVVGEVKVRNVIPEWFGFASDGTATNEFLKNGEGEPYWFLEECKLFLVSRFPDERNEILYNGLRRSIRIFEDQNLETTEDDLDNEFSGDLNFELSADDDIYPARLNSTAAGYSLQFFCKYAQRYPTRRHEMNEMIGHFADWLLALQYTDENIVRRGGFRLAPSETSCSTFGTSVAGMALLLAYKVTRIRKYLNAAILAANFCCNMHEINDAFEAVYGSGVVPIPSLTYNGATWAGFIDRINAADKINLTCGLINANALPFLKAMYEEVGTARYQTIYQACEGFFYTGLEGGYDFFAVYNPSPEDTYWTARYPNFGSLAPSDHAWHRVGENTLSGGLAVNTIGTDGIEYALRGLWQIGYSTEDLLTQYNKYADLSPAPTSDDFDDNYNGHICFTGYFRIDAPVYSNESRAYGSYYDVQGACTLLSFKKALAPTDFYLSLPMIWKVTRGGHIMKHDFSTKWTERDDGRSWATKGVLSIAQAGIGIIEGLDYPFVEVTG